MLLIDFGPQPSTRNGIVTSKGPSCSGCGDGNRDGAEHRDNKNQRRERDRTTGASQDAKKDIRNSLAQGRVQYVGQVREGRT